MKKLYTILCFILLTATSVVSANNLRFKHHAKAAEELTLKAPGYVVANEADTFKVSLLLKEDFSAFTDGSIEAPATTPVSTEAGWLPTSFTPNSGQWGGEQLYQAGGCAYIGLTESGLSGALTSPDVDLSKHEGNVIGPLRARKDKGNDPEAVRDWICCDMYEVNPNDPNDFRYFQRDYGNCYDEWNEYKFYYNFERRKDRNYFFQFYGYDAAAYIDDVEIKFLEPYVTAPVAKPHTNFTNDSFTANWESVEGADGYLIDLFTVGTDRYKTRTYIHRDLKVSGTSHTFTGIDTKDKAYHYVVKATKGGKISPESNKIRVQALLQPTGLSATYDNQNIKLSWNAVEGAQYYKVCVNRNHTAKSDETFIICRENFDKIGLSGSYLSPVYLDDQMEFDGVNGLPDWIAEYSLTIEGAIGLDGTAKSAYGHEVYMQSNYMNLAGSDGEITVKADLYNVDELSGAHYSPVIRLGNIADNVLTTVDSKSYRDIFDEWKSVEATLKGGKGTSVVEIAAMGGWLYIDNLEVSCKLKAGSSMSAPLLNAKIEANSVTLPMSDYLDNENITYTVTAVKEIWDAYHSSIDDLISSEPSEAYNFSIDLAGVESIIADPSTAPSDVYNLQGLKVLDAENADQINTLPAGVYITGGKKIYVK